MRDESHIVATIRGTEEPHAPNEGSYTVVDTKDGVFVEHGNRRISGPFRNDADALSMARIYANEYDEAVRHWRANSPNVEEVERLLRLSSRTKIEMGLSSRSYRKQWRRLRNPVCIPLKITVPNGPDSRILAPVPYEWFVRRLDLEALVDATQVHHLPFASVQSGRLNLLARAYVLDLPTSSLAIEFKMTWC